MATRLSLSQTRSLEGGHVYYGPIRAAPHSPLGTSDPICRTYVLMASRRPARLRASVAVDDQAWRFDQVPAVRVQGRSAAGAPTSDRDLPVRRPRALSRCVEKALRQWLETES